ncbi:MAG TPA: ATP-binding protein, partial [Polyangia bacterium]|nr:ATP-binding protein [Polyangia bacterium]
MTALGRYLILDTPPEPAFDRVCRTAAKLLRASSAVIALVEGDRVWFKARFDVPLTESQRQGSLFERALLLAGNDVLVVADAAADQGFAGGTTIACAPSARFFAAVPLRTPDGYNIGVLAVFDDAPRGAAQPLTALEYETLIGLAAMVMDEFEMRAAALRLQAPIVDAAEQRRLDSELIQAERLTALGTLAAGVAHEINNPLTYVLANIGFVAERLERARKEPIPGVAFEPDEVLAEMTAALAEAEEGAQRVRRIVRDLRIFATGDEERFGPVDLHHALESAISVAWGEIRHRARLIRKLGPVPTVEANESRLSQVFLNLLVNAAQAIREGGADQNEIRVITETDPVGRAVIQVQDTGSGITDDVIGRVFDPFFTTKPIGVGLGLGLFVSHGIVTALGGEIRVESAPGQGAS